MKPSQAKRAGEILSIIFDERLVKKAQVYSSLFAFWEEAVKKNGIAAAADHSRIKELDRGILLVEADHPGWKQILQTKQTKLLNDFRYKFPQENICGISLTLSRGGAQDNFESVQDISECTINNLATNGKESVSGFNTPLTALKGGVLNPSQTINKIMPSNQTESVCENINGYDTIKNEDFKATLKRLEKSITCREENKK